MQMVRDMQTAMGLVRKLVGRVAAGKVMDTKAISRPLQTKHRCEFECITGCGCMSARRAGWWGSMRRNWVVHGIEQHLHAAGLLQL
jgi:hypothetical protein